jgi:exopolysaccharide production protein ExoZ
VNLVTIQYLRGFAAALIVFHHAFAHPLLAGLYPVPLAQVGVDIFFVVSGVIMWVTTASKTFDNPWMFWRARIARVVPLYWLTTLAFIAASLAVPSQFFHAQLSGWFIASSFLFIPTKSPAGPIVPVYSLGWTLNYEMFFYLLFGFCLLARRSRTRLIAISVTMLSLVAAGLLFKHESAISITYSDPIILEFLCGILIGALFLRFRDQPIPVCGGPLTFVAAVVLFVFLVPSGGPRLVMFGLPASLAVAGALLSEMNGQRRQFKIGRLLGDSSYSIYLAHPFVLRPFFIAAATVTTAHSGLMQATLIVTAVIAGISGGVACYYLTERPITDFVGRAMRLSKRPSLVPSASGTNSGL